MHTRTTKTIIGVVLVFSGIALWVYLKYGVDALTALSVILIPTGIYLILIPKRVEEYKPTIVVKSQAMERRETRFWLTLKKIGTVILGLIIILFLAYKLSAYILLAVVLFIGVFISQLFKGWK